MRPMKLLCPLTLAALTAAGGAQAGDWQNTLTPYIWAAGMDGKTAIGPVEADVDVNFGDILDNLKFGGMLSYRGQNDRFVVLGDIVYMDLSADKSKDVGPIRVDASADAQQTMVEADGGYRFTPHIIGILGLRYMNLNVDVSETRTGPGPGVRRDAGGTEDWVDPVIGAIVEYPLAETWSLAVRGDVGGFGIGSDIAWQGMATVSWQASKNIHVVGAYRYIYADYDSRKNDRYFRYDIASSGPMLGASFSF